MENNQYTPGVSLANPTSSNIGTVGGALLVGLASKPLSELEQELSTYNGTINRLEVLINQLGAKTECVLKNNEPQKETIGNSIPRETSIGGRLNSMNFTFNSNLDILRDLINRIDL